jgi:hypothetical protein
MGNVTALWVMKAQHSFILRRAKVGWLGGTPTIGSALRLAGRPNFCHDGGNKFEPGAQAGANGTGVNTAS